MSRSLPVDPRTSAGRAIRRPVQGPGATWSSGDPHVMAVTPLWEGRVVLEELDEVLARLVALAGDTEPDALAPEVARAVLVKVAAVERAAAGLKLLLTRRALVGAPYEEQGHRSAASWLAEQTRTSVPEAVGAITTADRLAELPATAEAVRRGALSPLEARTVAAAATADPSAEADLLRAVRSLSVRGFCDYARRLAAAAHESDPDHRSELDRQRYFRGWTSADGMFRFS